MAKWGENGDFFFKVFTSFPVPSRNTAGLASVCPIFFPSSSPDPGRARSIASFCCSTAAVLGTAWHSTGEQPAHLSARRRRNPVAKPREAILPPDPSLHRSIRTNPALADGFSIPPPGKTPALPSPQHPPPLPHGGSRWMRMWGPVQVGDALTHGPHWGWTKNTPRGTARSSHGRRLSPKAAGGGDELAASKFTALPCALSTHD